MVLNTARYSTVGGCDVTGISGCACDYVMEGAGIADPERDART